MSARRPSTRRRSLLAIGAAAALALLTACANPMPGGGDAPDGTTGDGPIVVGSANFTESEILGNLYAEALRAKGFEVETRFGIGSREAYLPALADGSIDVIPDYTGNLLLYLDAEADVASPETIEAALPAALEQRGLVMLAPASAEDKDSVAVTRETAEAWGLESIGDLAAHNAELTIGGPPEFQERPVGLPGLERHYGVVPSQFVPIADGGGPATVQALLDGTVVAANLFTTSPAISEHDLVVLADPENNFPSQKVVPVVDAADASDELRAVLDAVSAKLTTEELMRLNERVSGSEKVEPRTAALDWLAEQGLV